MKPERLSQFTQRKSDHIDIALRPEVQAGQTGFDHIQLVHEALPELNFSDVSTQHKILGHEVSCPIFVSSMTAGHSDGESLNFRLARMAAEKNWLMGLGSQRRELFDPDAVSEWKRLRSEVPNVKLMSNLGLSQVIAANTQQIKSLVHGAEAIALIVHLNPLQECLQPEGTPQFAGGLKAIEELVKTLEVPVVIKETGCGFSEQTLSRLNNLGVAAVDVSGMGGTHWGRVEGVRAESADLVRYEAAKSFSNWGISTLESICAAVDVNPDYDIWASGGIRNGLDVAKAMAIGAHAVGMAGSLLSVAVQGEEALSLKMQQLEFELKTALFCTGNKNIHSLQAKQNWKWFEHE